MNLQIMPAREEEMSVVRNLVRFYVYDMSEHMGWDCPESGLFGGCDDLPQYWGRPPDNPQYGWPEGWKGHAFVVRGDGALAGFALARRTGTSPLEYDVGEFFVLRKFRRKGVGRHVAQAMFDRFPGRWQVRVLPDNAPAAAFWRAVVADYTDGNLEEFTGLPDAHCDAYVVLQFASRSGKGR